LLILINYLGKVNEFVENKEKQKLLFSTIKDIRKKRIAETAVKSNLRSKYYAS